MYYDEIGLRIQSTITMSRPIVSTAERTNYMIVSRERVESSLD